MRSDPTGELPLFVVGALVGIGEQFVCDIFTNLAKGKPVDTFSSAGTYVSAAINGAFATIPGGKLATTIARQIIAETAGLCVDAVTNQEEPSTLRVAKDIAPDGISNALSRRENQIINNLGANYKGDSKVIKSGIKIAKKATRTIIRSASHIIRFFVSLV